MLWRKSTNDVMNRKSVSAVIMMDIEWGKGEHHLQLPLMGILLRLGKSRGL